jgi:hypothetical protein
MADIDASERVVGHGRYGVEADFGWESDISMSESVMGEFWGFMKLSPR